MLSGGFPMIRTVGNLIDEIVLLEAAPCPYECVAAFQIKVSIDSASTLGFLPVNGHQE